jgi:hypothetical protein
MLTTSVVNKDHELEGTAERSREALARHRWHWTLDESNPGRVSIREYARQVGRDKRTIQDMVNGYATWAGGGAPPSELPDEMERAKLRGDKLDATEAVAAARGITVGSARRHHAEEVRQVQAAAAERVERSTESTTTASEARKVAEGRVKGEAARKRIENEKRRAHTIRYVRMEGFIASARRSVLAALTESQDVQFTDEERELIQHAADELRSILNLLDLRIVGDTDVDWDAELAKLGDSE